MIGRILRATGRGRTIIFTKTKRDAARVAEELVNRGFAAAPLHGDLNQVAREQALKAFRTGKVDILVATDVAARGIDVDDVTHVINHRVPEDEKTYLHRTGRTGRAGNEGTAITLVDWDDLPRWKAINDALELGVPEPVETDSRGRGGRSRDGEKGGRRGGRSRDGEKGGRSEGRRRSARSAERSSERSGSESEAPRAERAPRQRRRTRRVEGQPVEGKSAERQPRRRTRRRSSERSGAERPGAEG